MSNTWPQGISCPICRNLNSLLCSKNLSNCFTLSSHLCLCIPVSQKSFAHFQKRIQIQNCILLHLGAWSDSSPSPSSSVIVEVLHYATCLRWLPGGRVLDSTCKQTYLYCAICLFFYSLLKRQYGIWGEQSRFIDVNRQPSLVVVTYTKREMILLTCLAHYVQLSQTDYDFNTPSLFTGNTRWNNRSRLRLSLY